MSLHPPASTRSALSGANDNNTEPERREKELVTRRPTGANVTLFSLLNLVPCDKSLVT